MKSHSILSLRHESWGGPLPLAASLADSPPREPAAARLEQFVVGAENELAYWGVRRAVTEPAAAHSPLVIYGCPGVGKSHLAAGLYHELAGSRNHEPAVLVSAEEFGAQFGRALQEGRERAFRAYYRGLRLLVLDDVHRLAGRFKTQAELARTLDALEASGGLVVVTSRYAPAELRHFEARLVSRLEGGLAVPIGVPGVGSRRALLERFAGGLGVVFEDGAGELLAERLEGAPRELRGVVRTLAASGAGAISPAAVAALLAVQPLARRSRLVEIARTVARHFGLTVRALRSAERRRSITLARHVAMYLARELSGFSQAEISKFFGGRDHTTVIHACRRVHEQLASNAALRASVNELRAELALPAGE